jgi:hypothetical protein
MSGNDEDQNIINGEIPKLSRHHYKKQGTNYSRNKNNKELDRTELKIKLNNLALKLSNEKAINKPLANKIAKLFTAELDKKHYKMHIIIYNKLNIILKQENMETKNDH